MVTEDVSPRFSASVRVCNLALTQTASQLSGLQVSHLETRSWGGLGQVGPVSVQILHTFFLFYELTVTL